MNTAVQSLEYDVVIMGAGFAGFGQARHLLLNLPGIRVVIVDPRSLEADKKSIDWENQRLILPLSFSLKS